MPLVEQDYKSFLEGLMSPSEPKKGSKATPTPQLVKDFKENHTDTTVKFTIRLTEDGLKACSTEAALIKTFKVRVRKGRHVTPYHTA